MVRVAVISSPTPVRARLQDARREPDHELVGEHITVPSIEYSTDRIDIDYREGTIDEVYCLTGDDPDLLTVTIDADVQIHIDLSLEGQEEDIEA